MKKKYAHNDLPPDLQAFRDRFIAATEVEATMCGITFYKVHGRYLARTKSSLTGKRVKKDKRFRRTMQHAVVLALAVKYVTPIYNALTDDWHCQDLHRKLTGMAVKLVHQGNTKEAVQQAMYAELERLGYRTEWPAWELPPNLVQWLEEEESAGRRSASVCMDFFTGAECDTISADMFLWKWMVNEKGKLVLTLIDKEFNHDGEVAMPP